MRGVGPDKDSIPVLEAARHAFSCAAVGQMSHADDRNDRDDNTITQNEMRQMQDWPQ